MQQLPHVLSVPQFSSRNKTLLKWESTVVCMPAFVVKLPTRWEKSVTQERVIHMQLSTSHKHLPMPPSAGNDFQLLQSGVELTLTGGKCWCVVQEFVLYWRQHAGVLLQLLSLSFNTLEFFKAQKQTEKQKQFLYFLVEEHPCIRILSHLSWFQPEHPFSPLFKLQSKSCSCKWLISEQEQARDTRPGIE